MTNKNNFFFSQIERNNVFQDTTKQVSVNLFIPGAAIQIKSPDSSNANSLLNLRFNEQNIDSIFKKFEEREQQYLQEIRLNQIKKPAPKIDTIKLYYDNLGVYGNELVERLSEDPFQQNFLLNIPNNQVLIETKNKEVFKSNSTKGKNQNRSFVEKQIILKQRNNEIINNYDWISIIIFFSIILMGWTKLFFYNTFFSVIKSIASYQESSSLFREKNVVVERVFLILGFLFILVTAVFALQVAQNFNIGIGYKEQYLIFLGVLVSLIMLFFFRGLSSAFVGAVFLKQKVFSEHIHNVNIYTINTGILLLPIIILIQYLTVEYHVFFIYSGIGVVVLLYLMQLFRSFQIFIRKNVSIFYMILYLCAFEFAPFLIVYKLLLSLN